MNISLSQQVTATYARNHFKEVTDKALKEGVCFIMRKSKPTTVVLSMEEYEKLKQAENKWQERLKPKPVKKIDWKALEKDTTFDKFVGNWKNAYPGLTSVEVAKKWTDYVD